MSPDNHQAASCAGKEPFRERRHAEQAAKSVRRRRDARMQVYRCEHCHAFHIGQHLARKLPARGLTKAIRP